jgi:hypothetical protein
VSAPLLCIYEKCERHRSDRIPEPLCAHHARRVYLAVKDLVDGATYWQKAGSPTRLDSNGVREIARRDGEGFVYFAECGEVIKIGYSRNVKQRMRDIGADRLLASIPGTMQDERALHARFGPAWDHGEYFRPTPDLVAYIEGLGK